MDVSAKFIQFFLDLLLPLCAGYLLQYFSLVRPRFFDGMMRVGVLLVFPASVMLSLWDAGLSLMVIWLPVLGVLMQVVPGVVGYFRAKTKDYTSLETGSYLLAAMLANRGVVGGLSVFILFGEQSYAYSRIVMVLAPPMLLMLCFPMARYFSLRDSADGGARPSLRSILLNRNQVPLIGLVLGFALNLGDVPRPEFFRQVLGVTMHLLAWIFLIPVGASMDLAEMRRHWKSLLDLLPLKFVLTPLAMYGLGRLVGLEGEALRTVVVLGFAPTAINAVVAARLHDLNVHVATTAFVLTTGVYMVVVFPLILVTCALTGLT